MPRDCRQGRTPPTHVDGSERCFDGDPLADMTVSCCFPCLDVVSVACIACPQQMKQSKCRPTDASSSTPHILLVLVHMDEVDPADIPFSLVRWQQPVLVGSAHDAPSAASSKGDASLLRALIGGR